MVDYDRLLILLKVYDTFLLMDEMCFQLIGSHGVLYATTGAFKSVTGLCHLIAEYCPGYDESDEMNNWLFSLLDDRSVNVSDKAYFILCGMPSEKNQPILR